jgi:hypothetical protein
MLIFFVLLHKQVQEWEEKIRACQSASVNILEIQREGNLESLLPIIRVLVDFRLTVNRENENSTLCTNREWDNPRIRL